MIMAKMSMKMLTNMTHMQHYLRLCNVQAILEVWWIKMKSMLTYHVNELIWHSLRPYRAWGFGPIWLVYNTIQENAILKPPCKFGESKWNPYWVIMLTSSSGTTYARNEHDDFDQ